MKTNCIVCDKEVENWDEVYPEDDQRVHPINGTVFRTYGHYGSTVFDPMDASYLEVVVCDECLKKRLDRAYKGVDKKYREQKEKEREEMNEIVDQILIDRSAEDREAE